MSSDELPSKSNGYRVVAKCTNCGVYLTLWNNYRGEPELAHVGNLERTCSITYWATADRAVPELGLLDRSNQ